MKSFTDTYFKQIPAPVKRAMPIIKAPLHMNEMPYDFPEDLKRRLQKITEDIPYNRYPEPFAASLIAKLTQLYNCPAESILVGPGSSSFIRLLLTYFGMHHEGKLVITRPSFAYYEEFCTSFSITYDTWELDENFQYDISLLNNLPDYSVVFLTSPNNPIGNTISPTDVETLLRTHSRSLFVIDEVYAEFTNMILLPFVESNDNLLILRSFSKGMGAAGIRCGAAIGPPQLITALQKLQTPWQMSGFSIAAAKEIVEYNYETQWIDHQIEALRADRNRLSEKCTILGEGFFTVYPSEANFICLKADTLTAHDLLIQVCEQNGVAVSDLTSLPRLAGVIRISIGTRAHNNLFIHALRMTIVSLTTIPNSQGQSIVSTT